MEKLLILDNYESFTLVPYLKEKLSCEVWKMGNIYDERTFRILKDLKPDTVFVDFCDNNAVILSKRIKELDLKPKVVIRLHGYEIFSSFVDQIDWDQVSDLITVSPYYKKLVDRKLGNKIRTHAIYNGLNLDKFKLQTEFDDDSIAYVGYLNRKKGMTLLRTIMASTPNKNFHIGGIIQEPQVGMYMHDFNINNVKYYGWVKTEDFLKGKRFIVSTSILESFGMSIAEGMAMGLTPMVHAWPGSNELWPKECIWKTFDEFNSIKPMNPLKCREWVANRYSIDKCVNSIIDILKQ